MWYVYGLRCKDTSLYIGSTVNLWDRLTRHQNGETKSLRHKLPFVLEFYIAVKTEKVARSLEKYLKTGSGRAIIKKRFLPEEKAGSFPEAYRN